MKGLAKRGLLAFALVSAFGTSNVIAAEPFYAGKTITIIGGYSPGGGSDFFARFFSNYFVKFIPGEPRVIVQNMPAAGGIAAANHLYNKASNDGLTVGNIGNSNILTPLYGNPAAEWDSSKFLWIGSAGKQEALCATWHTSATKTLDDAKKRETVVGGNSPTSSDIVTPNLMNEVLGTKFKAISGYPSAQLRLAVEREEIEGICGVSYQGFISTKPEWFSERKLNLLAQFGLHKVPELPNVPNVLDLATKQIDREALELILIPQEMGRPFLLPPGSPAERVQELQAAFVKTMQDPGFIADAVKSNMETTWVGGPEMIELIKKAYGFEKPVITRSGQLQGR